MIPVHTPTKFYQTSFKFFRATLFRDRMTNITVNVTSLGQLIKENMTHTLKKGYKGSFVCSLCWSPHVCMVLSVHAGFLYQFFTSDLKN